VERPSSGTVEASALDDEMPLVASQACGILQLCRTPNHHNCWTGNMARPRSRMPGLRKGWLSQSDAALDPMPLSGGTSSALWSDSVQYDDQSYSCHRCLRIGSIAHVSFAWIANCVKNGQRGEELLSETKLNGSASIPPYAGRRNVLLDS
jgi:hypothetical protein